MKIDATGPLRPSATRRTVKNTGGGAFRLEHAGNSDSEAEVPQAAASRPSAAVDALLAIQEVPDSVSGGRSKGLRHGFDILDKLDQLRLCLLTGTIAPHRLHQLAATLRARRQTTADPRLDAILAEIELRAAVEIAKFETAGRA